MKHGSRGLIVLSRKINFHEATIDQGLTGEAEFRRSREDAGVEKTTLSNSLPPTTIKPLPLLVDGLTSSTDAGEYCSTTQVSAPEV